MEVPDPKVTLVYYDPNAKNYTIKNIKKILLEYAQIKNMVSSELEKMELSDLEGIIKAYNYYCE